VNNADFITTSGPNSCNTWATPVAAFGLPQLSHLGYPSALTRGRCQREGTRAKCRSAPKRATACSYVQWRAIMCSHAPERAELYQGVQPRAQCAAACSRAMYR
jgi:hypothetical protein